MLFLIIIKSQSIKNTHHKTRPMNIALFTKLWPRHDQSFQLEKTISLVQSLINLNHKIVICSDDENSKSKEELSEYPMQLLDINSRKISNSLNAMTKLQFKPNIFIFDSFQTEEKYSAFLYNRWNKCARVLAVDQLKGLQKWRKSMYKIMPNMLIPPNTMMSPQKPEQIFTIEQQRSILRCDYILTSNQHNYHLINKYLLNKKQTKYISQVNYGFPLQEYYGEVAQLMYRPFKNRENFVFLGNFQKQTNQDAIFQLINFIWPLIREKLNNSELHIYGVHGESGVSEKLSNNWGINKSREELKKLGIQFRGVMKSTQQLSQYKALLYPCIYSTGGHFKTIQSWFMHLPVVTTPIGGEGQFLQCYDPSAGMSQANNRSNTFSAERVYTEQEKKSSQKIRNYYNNRILSKNSSLTFGGSYNNFSYKDFVESAIKINNDEQYWNQCLENGHKIIKKNQCDRHLQVVIKKALVNIEIATYEGRSRTAYEQQWKRYTKSPQFNKKIRTL